MSLRRLAASTPVHVAIGFAAMGGWAVWANAAHGAGPALLAGLVQGAISGALTLGLKQSVDWMRPRMRGPLAYVAPPLIAVICSALILITAHGLAGTPEIWTTIAVPLAVSFSYIFAYNILRQRASERTPHA
ncbi:hypothetical protein ACEWPM_010995 [Roseovarius sp. S4756]|uniref:hypothetical protein n=1 Tax=Roseovarius maritimus TaxID=3342637 RepID=UPI003726C67C